VDVKQVPGERSRVMYSPYLAGMYNSARANGRLRGHRLALPILLSQDLGILIAPVSTLWVHNILESSDHAFVNPPDGRGYGKHSHGHKPILTTFYQTPPAGTDQKPRDLLRALTTQRKTVRSVAYPWFPAAGTVEAAAYNTPIQNLPWNVNYHQSGSLVLTVPEYKRLWKTIQTVPGGELTTDRMEAAALEKNDCADVVAEGMVLTMSFPLAGSPHERESISVLTLALECIDFEHTKEGKDVT